MAPRSKDREANGLLAVLLITRSRPGPKLVFHYPPEPERKTASRSSKPHKDDDGLSGLDSSSGEDADDRQVRQRGESNSTVRHVGTGEDASSDSLDRILGVHIESLEKLLAPGRWSEKKKFEVCLDGVTYVGLPVFAKEDGSGWSKRGKLTAPQREAKEEAPLNISPEKDDAEEIEAVVGSAGASSVTGITITKPDQPRPPPILSDYTHMPDSLDSSNLTSLGTSMNSTSTTSAVVGEQMSMFNVVFALDTSQTLNTMTPQTLYEQVIVRLSQALKYCQKQSGYVSLESRKLQALKTKARLDKIPSSTFSTRTLEHSELAWALQEVYIRLSTNETATVRLVGHELSLQIPPDSTNDTSEISHNSALLLLEDKETLLQCLTHHSSAPLAYFIRETLPTKTLAKQAAKLGIPENTVLHLAQHLVEWRKARPINALHPRNTYIVSPEAPLDRLAGLSEAYARRFPSLPSLENMLAMLGGKPVRFGALIQSPAHRASYIEILAWLARLGWVVQLKTFGWLRLGPKPLVLSREAVAQEKHGGGSGSASGRSDRTAFANGSVDDRQEPSGLEQTTLEREPHLITDPLDLSSESRAAIRSIRTAVEDLELGDRFQTLVKYFDGEHAFEEIAASEGVKRGCVEQLLGVLEKTGWLVTYRAM